MKKLQRSPYYAFMIYIFAIVLLGMMPQKTLSDSGKPAARLGDRTTHGGIITLGCANVLIGGMPAARVGDMHTCPMVEPGPAPIPHVGGSIVMGSPTVFIGGMPAARVGDMATCVGPPDSIMLGCPSVLIGTGIAGTPKKYTEDYIKTKYDKSFVISQQKFKRTKKEKDR